MKKLPKIRQMERDGLVAELRKAEASLEAAHVAYLAAIETYNEQLGDAVEWRNEIVGTMEDYMGEKSERWQEGDNGQAYAEWKRQFENLELEEVAEPEELEFTAADRLEELPDSPGQE